MRAKLEEALRILMNESVHVGAARALLREVLSKLPVEEDAAKGCDWCHGLFDLHLATPEDGITYQVCAECHINHFGCGVYDDPDVEAPAWMMRFMAEKEGRPYLDGLPSTKECTCRDDDVAPCPFCTEHIRGAKDWGGTGGAQRPYEEFRNVYTECDDE